MTDETYIEEELAYIDTIDYIMSPDSKFHI